MFRNLINDSSNIHILFSRKNNKGRSCCTVGPMSVVRPSVRPLCYCLSVHPVTCPSVCMSVLPSIYSSVYPSDQQSVYLSISLSIWLSAGIPVCLSVQLLSIRLYVYPSGFPSACLFFYPCVRQSVLLAVCPSICSFVHLLFRPFTCLFIRPPVCLFTQLSVRLPVLPSVYPPVCLIKNTNFKNYPNLFLINNEDNFEAKVRA